MASNSFSVLGPDLKVTGNISASEDLHIDGSVDGDINCASLVQGEASAITGAIQADSARLAGTVEGSITAKTLVILKTAKITGDVFYDTLTIEQGATVEGKFAQRAHGSAHAESSDDGEPKLSLAN
ncbi:bactofilin family protein [Croceicoccus mobilis]|uniref:Cell shape determination protein CcmA n=1 Tax=Croceicoccus mobilis TaxID=1703339 RepID=A0A916YSW2_9SPHN|nr:polymer-forming cytoskeletal protein [Croceicoccus mobilis]GGD59848.1 hypothetical protein GCM10010990_06560 [Croceicoccus mobilis]